MVLGHETAEGKRTEDIKTSQGTTFSSMLLAPKTLEGLQKSGFFKPSPIQLHAIPLGKCGFDLILEAKSGTGKTAVFAIIALEKLDLQKGLQTIIVTPTREIAAQVCDVLKQIGCSYTGLQVKVVMGGLPVEEDIDKLNKKVHILVGSPGRLLHLIKEKYINLASVRLLVLDEADRLLDDAFLKDIEFLFSRIPKQKQTIMSSATFPIKITETIKKYMQGVQHICPHTDQILLGIKQRVTFVKQNVNIVKQTKFRFEELLKILSRKPFKQCLIFCNYQSRVVGVGKMLKKEKWPAEQLYGQQKQTDRLDALRTLQDYGCRILVSTDLAARGIDASNVDLVVNFEPTFEWQTYLHRIGRAGRFGSYGTAVTILSEGQEENKFKRMLEEIKGSINMENFWDVEEIVADVESNAANSTQTESIPPETAEHEQIQQMLWNIMTSPAKQDSNEMESLETPKEAKETGLKTFSDLLNSFSVYEPNNELNEESRYQCLSQPVIPIAEYYPIINNILTKTDMSAKDIKVHEKCQTEEINNDMLNVNIKELNINSKSALATAEDNIEILDDLKNDDNNYNNYKFKDLELADARHTSQLHTVFGSSEDRKLINLPLVTAEENIETIYHLQNGSNGNKDFKDSEVTDALHAAGLPTAFSSTKNRNWKKRIICKTNNKKSIENSSFGFLSSKTSHQNNISNNDVHSNGMDEMRVQALEDHTFTNDPVNEYSRALKFSEPNTSNYYQNKKESNFINNTSQSKNVYKDTFANSLQVCDNTSQYQRCKKTEYTQNCVKQHNSNIEVLYGFTNKYGNQDVTCKPRCFSKCSENEDDDLESDSFEEPALSPDYLHWYKTLKYRALQVQLAVYIDELSKF